MNKYIYIFIILGIAFICLSVYSFVSHCITIKKLKKHQKEWDSIRKMLIELFPNITQGDLCEYYLIYINSIDGYFPRPNIVGEVISNE